MNNNSFFNNLPENYGWYFLIIGVVIFFAIFMVMREVICWYYKINEKIELLQSIDNKLERLCLANEKEGYKHPKIYKKVNIEVKKIVPEIVTEIESEIDTSPETVIETNKNSIMDLLTKEIRISDLFKSKNKQ